MENHKFILEMKDIRKTFLNGKIVANDNINLKIEKGEKHAIVGENGAGKSTLMKILNGLYQPTSGKIIYNGKEVEVGDPSAAVDLGIGMVYQHFMLVPTLSVTENMILGVEPKKGAFIDFKEAREKVVEVSKKYGLNIDPDALVGDLSVGIQQRVEILKILFKGANLLVFDEPTAVLTPQEVKGLYKIMDNLIAEGKTIIFISHKLQEVLDISDNITVIRRGKDIETFPTKEATKERIANAMVGRSVLFTSERKDVKIGEKVLSVDGLKVKNDKGSLGLKGISFDIKKGEVVGIAGVEGSGQSELIDAITGLRKIDSGDIIVEGRSIKGLSPRKIGKVGISHIPEDRLKRAAISEFSVAETYAFGEHKDNYSKGGIFLDFKKIFTKAREYNEKYDVRPREEKANFGGFSGGNQQKIIVARELEKKHKVIIAAQPTRGVDIGAIESIHQMILEEKEKEKGVLLISAELTEILNLSDKILVMCAGEISGVLSREEATEEKIGILMTGGKI